MCQKILIMIAAPASCHRNFACKACELTNIHSAPHSYTQSLKEVTLTDNSSCSNHNSLYFSKVRSAISFLLWLSIYKTRLSKKCFKHARISLESHLHREMSTSLILKKRPESSSRDGDEPVCWSLEPGGDHCDHAEPGQWSPLTALC